MYDQETHYFVMQARISAHFKDSIVLGFLLSTLCLICFIVFVGKNVAALKHAGIYKKKIMKLKMIGKQHKLVTHFTIDTTQNVLKEDF